MLRQLHVRGEVLARRQDRTEPADAVSSTGRH